MTLPTLKPLAELVAGDYVLVEHQHGYGDRKHFTVRVIRIEAAGPKRIRLVDGFQYVRATGKSVGRQGSRLLEATVENVVRLTTKKQAEAADQAERDARQEQFEAEQRLKAHAGAAWLLAQRCPETMIRHLGVQPLVDVANWVESRKQKETDRGDGTFGDGTAGKGEGG